MRGLHAIETGICNDSDLIVIGESVDSSCVDTTACRAAANDERIDLLSDQIRSNSSGHSIGLSYECSPNAPVDVKCRRVIPAAEPSICR